MKKSLPIIVAALLTASVLTGCASKNNPAPQKLPSEQNNATAQNGEPTIIQTPLPENGTASPTTSPSASAAYEKLLAYKTEDYRRQSIADFNAALAATPDELTEFLAAEADVISAISANDENYGFFTTTMSFSAHELYCEHMGEELTYFVDLSKQSGICDYLDEDGEPVYGFNCFVDLNVAYSIKAPELVTVAERDDILLTFKEELQNYLNGLSEAEIKDNNIRETLADKAAELANRLSTENMQLSSCEIYMIDINEVGED